MRLRTLIVAAIPILGGLASAQQQPFNDDGVKKEQRSYQAWTELLAYGPVSDDPLERCGKDEADCGEQVECHISFKSAHIELCRVQPLFTSVCNAVSRIDRYTDKYFIEKCFLFVVSIRCVPKPDPMFP